MSKEVTHNGLARSVSIKSEKEYNDFYENAPDMFVSVCAKTGSILKCNRTTATTLEYKKSEILGRQIFDLYTPESGEYARNVVFPLFLKKGYIDRAELEIQKKDGRTINVLLKASSVRDADGNIIESRSVWRDITQQKRAEEALQKTLAHLENMVDVRTVELKRANERLTQKIDESRKIAEELKKSEIRYRTVADFTFDWETWMDPEGNFVYVSPSCERISGYCPNEFIRDPDLLIKITHPDDRNLVEDHFKSGEAHKSLMDPIDFRITNRKGELVWISHACRMVHDSENNYLGRRGSNRDITVTKAYQIELEKYAETQSILLKKINHRVNNTMASILSLMELQMEEVEDEMAKKTLRDSHSLVRKICLIDETLSHFDDLKVIHMKTFLSKIGSTALQGYSTGNDVKLQIEAENVMIGFKQASPVGLIVNELIVSCLEYAFPDDRKGEIILRLKSNKENEIELSVSDNGIGLPERFDLQYTDNPGFKLVRMLAENQLNGSIDMDSENGTKFTVKFNIET